MVLHPTNIVNFDGQANLFPVGEVHQLGGVLEELAAIIFNSVKLSQEPLDSLCNTENI